MIRNAIRLGRVGDIEIGLDYSWLVVFVLVVWTLTAHYFPSTYPDWAGSTYWIVGILTSLLFFASVIAHELGHSLVAVRVGLPVASITLFIFGGVAQLGREPDRAIHEFWIAIAGPAVSVVLGILFAALATLSADPTVPLAALAGWLGYINLALAAFNFIPGFPLDGGRVFRAVLWGLTRDLLRATRIATIVGRGVGYAFMLLGIVLVFDGNLWNGLWLVFIGWFLEKAASTSYDQLSLRESLSDLTVGRLAHRDLPEVAPDEALDRVVDDHILETGRRFLAVVDGDRLLGIVTLHRLRDVPREEWPHRRVEEAMLPRDQAITVAPETPLYDVLTHLSPDGVNQVAVLDGDRFLGIVSRDQVVDFMRARAELGI